MSEEQKKILLVEDDEAILESMRELLEMEGYAVDSAMNGAEALKILRANDPPSLILLDIMMPVMDGYQFREAQLADPKLASIPVIVMTAAGRVELAKTRLPSDQYIKKPIDIEQLLTAVKTYSF